LAAAALFAAAPLSGAPLNAPERIAPPGGPGQGGSYAVVVGPDVPIAELSMEELRRVFLFKRLFWKPGKPVRLILPATGQPARAFLLDQVCQRSEGDLRRLILESMYRGETDQAPKVAASEAETLTAVASLAGAIALVPSESSLPTGVKALRIDGKLAGEPGYPLGQ
jgi:hypothetical protein